MALFWSELIITIGVAFFQWFILKLVGALFDSIINLTQRPLFNVKRGNTKAIKIIVTLFALIALGLGTKEIMGFSAFEEVAIENQGLQTSLLFLFLLLPWINLALPFKKKFTFPFILAFHVSTVKILFWMIALVNPLNLIFPDENDFDLSPAALSLKQSTIILLGIYYLISLGWLFLAEQRIQQKYSKKTSSKLENE